MKKYMFIILFFFLLLPIISAVELDMKPEFSQGETLMAKVSGNFIEPILKENIFFYRGHVRISVNPDVAKIDDEFYIYAQLLDKTPNNYSISLENVKYMQGSQISEENIVMNFSIAEDTADFLINPGFIITKDDFFIEVQNLQDSQITIQIKTNTILGNTQGFFASLFGNTEQEEKSVTLKSGEIEKINFELEDITQPTLKTIELSTENLKYEIPVYIYLNETVSDKKEKEFEFAPSELDVSMSTNSNATRIIYLENIGEEALENISLSVSESLKPYISFSIKEIEDLEENSSIKIEIEFFSHNEEKTIEGQITAREGNNIYTYCAVFLNFIKDYTPLDGETPSTRTCEEMDGEICSEDQECKGETKYAKDGKCCLGTCKKIEESSTGKRIGWTIVFAILVFLIWFFKEKYRGAKKTVDLFKVSKGKK